LKSTTESLSIHNLETNLMKHFFVLYYKRFTVVNYKYKVYFKLKSYLRL